MCLTSWVKHNQVVIFSVGPLSSFLSRKQKKFCFDFVFVFPSKHLLGLVIHVMCCLLTNTCLRNKAHSSKREIPLPFVQLPNSVLHTQTLEWWWWFCLSLVFNSFATLWTVACQVRLFMGFSRQEYLSGLPLPSPGDRPNPGIELGSPALAGGFFTTEPSGKPRS